MIKIEAQFAEREGNLNGVVIERTPLLITSTVYKLIPFLIISNRVLNSIVWTSSSNTRNLSIIILLSIMILHWGDYTLLLMPTLLSVLICGIIWILNKSVMPLKLTSTTPNGEDLTMTQMFNSIVNFNAICEFLFPIEKNLNFDLQPVFIGSILITPIYMYLIQKVINIRVYILIVFLGLSLWYSSMFVVSRAILWRWKVFRWVVNYPLKTTARFNGRSLMVSNQEIPIGIDINMMINDFGMKLNKIDSKTSLVELYVYENERYIIGIGWGKRFLIGRFGFSSMDGRFNWNNKMSIVKSVEMGLGDNFRWLQNNWEITQNWTYGDCMWRINSSSRKGTRWRVITKRGLVSS